MSNLREECGVMGVYVPESQAVARKVYYGLYALQHRGQESCGIVVNDDGLFNTYKDAGLVNDVFTPRVLEKLGDGTMAVGHVRYGTTGNDARTNAQPIVVNHIKGRMALAHNGNLTNSAELREALELQGSIFHTTSDTEVISYIITKNRLTTGSIEEAVSASMDTIKGAYSLVIMSPSKLIAARDPHGFRPLCIGTLEGGGYIFASESCAIDAVGGKFLRDVEPGEIVVVSKNGLKSNKVHCNIAKKRMCVFEFLYFARPDSVMDGCPVHLARLKAGAYLAKQFPIDADLVIGVPDSGIDAAVGYSKNSGIPYEMGFIKNKYIGRTFISPDQKSRDEGVRIKLNPIPSVVEGKRVILIDDSIVRGTTCGKIVKLLRDAGAKEVHMLSSAPRFLNPCYYGTDIDSRENLIACHHTVEETAEIIGADSLGYLSVENVKKVADCGSMEFCTACFDGDYPTPVPTETKKNRFEFKISDNKGE